MDGENELPVRELEEELLVEVFGKQKGSLLRAGRTEIKALTRKGAEVFQTACGIGALNTGDALGVVAAAFESVHHSGDPFQAELAVVLCVERVVGLGEILEMIVEDTREGIRPAWDIPGGGGCGRDRGEKRGHTPKNSRKVRTIGKVTRST